MLYIDKGICHYVIVIVLFVILSAFRELKNKTKQNKKIEKKETEKQNKTKQNKTKNKTKQNKNLENNRKTKENKTKKHNYFPRRYGSSKLVNQ